MNTIDTEVATGGVPLKKVFLKICQISQENTCVGVKPTTLLACNFVKKRLQHGVFL